MTDKLLSRADIEGALRALAAEVHHDVPVRLFLVGGAAMCLAHGARPSTADVDVVIMDADARDEILAGARRVADALRLPSNWLSDEVRRFSRASRRGKSRCALQRSSCTWPLLSSSWR